MLISSSSFSIVFGLFSSFAFSLREPLSVAPKGRSDRRRRQRRLMQKSTSTTRKKMREDRENKELIKRLRTFSSNFSSSISVKNIAQVSANLIRLVEFRSFRLFFCLRRIRDS